MQSPGKTGAKLSAAPAAVAPAGELRVCLSPLSTPSRAGLLFATRPPRRGGGRRKLVTRMLAELDAALWTVGGRGWSVKNTTALRRDIESQGRQLWVAYTETVTWNQVRSSAGPARVPH
jgi:hypothetical protein